MLCVALIQTTGGLINIQDVLSIYNVYCVLLCKEAMRQTQHISPEPQCKNIGTKLSSINPWITEYI